MPDMDFNFSSPGVAPIDIGDVDMTKPGKDVGFLTAMGEPSLKHHKVTKVHTGKHDKCGVAVHLPAMINASLKNNCLSPDQRQSLAQALLGKSNVMAPPTVPAGVAPATIPQKK
eukprot:PhM_4_TR8163/c0_g1_i1/m.12164